MAPSDIVVSPVATKADLKAFIQLPKRLYAGHKGYVAPLDVERKEAFSPDKNPLFEHVEVQILPGAARRPGGRPHLGADRPCLSRALCRQHRSLRLPGRRGRSGDLRRPVRGGRGLAERQGHEAGDRPVQPVGQRGGGPADRRLRQPSGPPGSLRPALCRRAGRGCGYAKIKDLFSYDYDVQNAPETIGAKLLARAGMDGTGQGPHRQHEDVRRRGAHPGRHLQRRLERQLGFRALHPGRDRPCLQGVRAGDRARARRIRGRRRRERGLHRGAHQPQRGDRGLRRPARSAEPGQAPVAPQDRRRRQHARAADGREEEVPQPSADGGRARHDRHRPPRGPTASGWARPRPSSAGSSRTTRRPTTSSARSAECTTRPTGSTRRPWGDHAAVRRRPAGVGLRSTRQPRVPGAVDRQPAVEHRRLDGDHGGGVGDDQPDAGADLRGAAVGRRHLADVPVLLSSPASWPTASTAVATSSSASSG